ncbi:hypothetical protein AMATHDRAFT_160641, partial [Amanita thiersii Skay4041]
SMFFDIFGKDKNVVHINNHPTLGNFCSEYIIHHGLKCHWRTPICPECGLPLITIFDPDVIIPPANIHFRKIFHFRQFVN